jgi:hypothetical protein
MRRSNVVAAIAVVWAAFVVLKALAGGLHFNGGSYGAGQGFAVVLALVALIVGIRHLVRARATA